MSWQKSIATALTPCSRVTREPATVSTCKQHFTAAAAPSAASFNNFYPLTKVSYFDLVMTTENVVFAKDGCGIWTKPCRIFYYRCFPTGSWMNTTLYSSINLLIKEQTQEINRRMSLTGLLNLEWQALLFNWSQCFDPVAVTPQAKCGHLSEVLYVNTCQQTNELTDSRWNMCHKFNSIWQLLMLWQT